MADGGAADLAKVFSAARAAAVFWNDAQHSGAFRPQPLPSPPIPDLVPPAADASARESGAFLLRLRGATQRPGGLAALAGRLALRALRGRLPRMPSVRVAGAASVSELGARVIAAVTSAEAVPAAVASTFSRYGEALRSGGQVPLPFTVEKVCGYLFAYVACWGQSSASLEAVVTNLRSYAAHFELPWLCERDVRLVARVRNELEQAYPAEIAFAESVQEETVVRILAHLDSLGAANVWAVAMAALLALSYGLASRPSEPLHALARDVRIAADDAGVLFERHHHKTAKSTFDARSDTARAPARPGSPCCPVQRLRAYLALVRPAPLDRLFPRRDIRTGAALPGKLTEPAYKKAFQAVAVAAGVKGGAALKPRGLRGGSATADRLAGVPAPAVDERVGWADPTTQQRYVHGHVVGLALDALARPASRR